MASPPMLKGPDASSPMLRLRVLLQQLEAILKLAGVGLQLLILFVLEDLHISSYFRSAFVADQGCETI
ncbi:hypothetical protein ACFX1S_007452 [Malus domestica]